MSFSKFSGGLFAQFEDKYFCDRPPFILSLKCVLLLPVTPDFKSFGLLKTVALILFSLHGN